MNSFKESLSFWATILGTLLGFLGVIQSEQWITLAGAIVVIASISALLYARRQRSLVKLAEVSIGGRSIDSFNVASLRRRVNRTLAIQRAHNTATIVGEDLTVTWECSGYCVRGPEGTVEFSVDTDNNLPFADLDCYAYDLQRDPEKRHKIRPMLIGPDGISKKVVVPLLEPLLTGEQFGVLFSCVLPGCVKDGVDYYTASLSFDQRQLRHYSVRLVFMTTRPEWLRVYECDSEGTMRLLKDLPPQREAARDAEYVDVAEAMPARSARIYLFDRPKNTKAARIGRAA